MTLTEAVTAAMGYLYPKPDSSVEAAIKKMRDDLLAYTPSRTVPLQSHAAPPPFGGSKPSLP
ncbi:hypothetical protein [Cumulibacter manganitolerans]|uniref:hypothetical protein n=1 Tax=Cumulibacter manganitolerans TaxID=1884992 RepID=UPI0012967516|nr:hypothetical protein [Cumulibacter manganitolerans]